MLRSFWAVALLASRKVEANAFRAWLGHYREREQIVPGTCDCYVVVTMGLEREAAPVDDEVCCDDLVRIQVGSGPARL